MRAYSPQQWDTLKKQEHQQELKVWVREQQMAQQLLAQAREDLHRILKELPETHADLESLSQELHMVREDFIVARRALAKPRPELKRPSYTDPMASQSHAQCLADMKVMMIPVRLDPLTASESERTRYKTYRSVLNVKKRVRRLIRAGGGQAG